MVPPVIAALGRMCTLWSGVTSVVANRPMSVTRPVVPAAVIIMREVLVSGLREYLGDVKLPVTRLAKWKTTLQMFAIGFLLGAGALDAGELGGAAGEDGLPVLAGARDFLAASGLALLWIAASLTLVSGGDYFLRGLAYIRRQARAEGGAREAADVSPGPGVEPPVEPEVEREVERK